MSIICASRSDFSLLLGASARWPWGGGATAGKVHGARKIAIFAQKLEKRSRGVQIVKKRFSGGPYID